MQIQDQGTTKYIRKKSKSIQPQSIQRSSCFCPQSPQIKKIRKTSHSSFHNHNQAETFHDSFSLNLDSTTHEENNSIHSETFLENFQGFRNVTEGIRNLHIDEIQEEPQVQENDRGSDDDDCYYSDITLSNVELGSIQTLINIEQQFI